MTSSAPTHYSDIDWDLLWQNAISEKSWKSKKVSDWDKKAASFAKRNRPSPFVSLFLSQLPQETQLSILDVGAGPGTLAIPLAGKGHTVTALDYSAGMIRELTAQKNRRGFAHLKVIQCAWEDDWPSLGIVPHDITIASRSLNVANLRLALTKLNNFATQAVFIVDRINPTPFDPEAFAAIGRPFKPGPDYIYTVNTLYDMGIHPQITTLHLEQESLYSCFDDILGSYRWMFHDISADELRRLTDYIESHTEAAGPDKLRLTRPHPPRWAMIWWQKGS